MNSLNWLFAPRSRPLLHPLHQSPRHDQQSVGSSPSSATPPDSLGTGPRESESELVDSMLESVQRRSGAEAANTLERKAVITPDGQLRLGLPGITERRRTLNLNVDEDRPAFSIPVPIAPIVSITPLDPVPSGPTDLSAIRSSATSPILSSLSSASARLTGPSISASSSSPQMALSGHPSSTSQHPRSPPKASSLPPGPSSPSTNLPRPSTSIPALSSPSAHPPALTTKFAISMAESDPKKRYHRLARLLPIRLGINLYILIRKFLALFRLRLPPPRSDDPSSPLLVAEPQQLETPMLKVPFSAATPRTPLYSLFWRSAPLPPIPIPTIIPDDEVTGTLVMTDASSSADDSDSTLSSNPAPGPRPSCSSSSSLLRPPPRQSSARLRRIIAKTPAPGPAKRIESKAVLAGTRTKTLVLDLDETLIHSTSRLGGMGGSGVLGGGGGPVHAGLKVRVVEVVLDGRIVVYHVYKRPWVDFFLKTVASWYTVVIFTASMREYADPVIDWLDQGRGLIDGRLFRESCTNIKGSYMKDLTIIERDLSNVCLVDNSPISYGLHEANGIPIEGWLNDPSDEGLLDLLPILDSLRFTKDVRRILGLRGFGFASNSSAVPASSSGNTTGSTKTS